MLCWLKTALWDSISVHIRPSPQEGARKEKKMREKNVQTMPPTCIVRATGPCPFIYQISRTPWLEPSHHLITLVAGTFTRPETKTCLQLLATLCCRSTRQHSTTLLHLPPSLIMKAVCNGNPFTVENISPPAGLNSWLLDQWASA